MIPVAQAQTPSDIATQEALRQQERERALREQFQRTPDVRLPREVLPELPLLPKDETPCFTIREIALDSDAAPFAWALAAANPPSDVATGRCLGGEGINRVMTRIQNAIIEKGFVTTRVLAEPQDLKHGKLVLKIIPGRIRAIRFTEDSDSRANAWNAFPAKPGDILNLRDVEQALENFKRVPSAEADIQIVPGEQPGESDLVIAWKQAFPLRFNVSANDGGLRTTGKYLGSVTVSGDHLLTLNDLFYVSFNQDLGGGAPGSRGTRGHTAFYSLPFDYWTLGVTASANRYHQSVAGANQTYVYSGVSETYDAKLSRIVYRDATNKSSVSLRGYLTKYNNFIDDTEIEIQRRRMAGWEAGMSHRHFMGQATADFNLAYRQGTGAFSALTAPEDASGDGTARPTIISTDNTLSLPFKLAENQLRYNLQWRGQWNRTPLVPQDRFSIGGRYTVRGYDGQSVLLGDRGWLVRNDLALSLSGSHELYLGADHGEVGGRSASFLVGNRLTGAVLGVRGGYQGLSWDLFAGQPLRKPDGFKTASTTAGFNLSLSF